MSWLPKRLEAWSRRYEWFPSSDAQMGTVGYGDLRWWTEPRRFAIPTRLGTAVFLVPFLLALLTLPWLSRADQQSTQLRIQEICTAAVVLRWLLRGGWVTVDPLRRELRWKRPGRIGPATQIWSFDEISGARARGGWIADTVYVRVRRRRVPFRVSRGSGTALAAALREGVGSADVIPDVVAASGDLPSA